MSHHLELEAPFSIPMTQICRARLTLEFISKPVSDPNPGNINPLLQVALDQQATNERRIETDAHHLHEFTAGGMLKGKLRQVRTKLLGKRAPGPYTAIRPPAIKALVLDAKPWLRALREYGHRHPESVTGDQSLAGWHEALPFLDSPELSYVVSKEGRESWRRTATFLVQRRLAADAERNRLLGTVYEYAFGPAEASKFRNTKWANQNSITPPVPRLNT